MNFDRLAPHYDWMEAVSGPRLLQQARTAWLDELQGRHHLLSAGEGHGRFAESCLSRHPQLELTCVEASAGMIARAKNRTRRHSARVNWHHENLLDWNPVKKYDALATCFFLDCFPADQLARVVAHLASCASAKAVWLVTDFSLPASGPARWRALVAHSMMYAFFRHATGLPACQLTPPDHLLRAHGFTLWRRREFSCGLLRADAWHRA